MKILFSADWHIHTRKSKVPVDWSLNRYRMLFKKIEEIDCNIHVVGGDIFDKLPSLEELGIFFEFISNTKHQTLLYSGNHEASKRGQSWLPLLSDTVTRLNPKCKIISEPTAFDEFDIIPYTHIHTFDPDDFHNKILLTHVRGLIAPHVRPEIDLDRLNRWDVVLAGDLHSYSNSQRNILYPGSPYSISFHRSPVKTGVIVLDTETLEHEWIDLGLPQLYRKTVNSVEEAIPSTFDFTIYEIKGNVDELSNIDMNSSEILDKKIVHKSYESTLNLENKTIKEELELYLKSILKLDNTKIGSLLTIYENYTARN